MRQKENAIERVRRRNRHRRRLLHRALMDDVYDEVLFRLQRRHNKAASDVLLLQFRSVASTTFNINSLSTKRCLTLFRFRPSQIINVSALTGWISGRTKHSRYKVPSFTATCIMLRRLSSLTRWVDMEPMFGMRSSALSEVFWEIIEAIIESKVHLLKTFCPSQMDSNAAKHASSVHEKGAPLDNRVGFVDCTKIQMCRTGGRTIMQRSCYSGQKRFHCLIYQSMTTPDGLMYYLYGLEVGRRHDMTLYRDSGLDVVLQNALLMDEQQFCLYGDAAYIMRTWLPIAFPLIRASAPKAAYNTAMHIMHEAVEWT